MLDRTAEDWAEWLDEFSNGSNREAWRGIQCFLRWIQIRALNGYAIPEFLPGLEGDIFHSLLLRRMLDGKEPLTAPPPESHGQAWYDLLENGRAEGVEVQRWEWAPDLKIAINRGIWTILERKSETDLIVTYRTGGQRFTLRQREDGIWLLERTPS